jgi:flagellar hook assembly protein FlgD
VRIFDQQGHIVKELARNELLGTDGFIRWEGDQNNGSRARTGYYMIWFEVFDSTGLLQTFRKRIVLY